MTKVTKKLKNVPAVATVEYVTEVMLICYLCKVVSMPACV